MTFKELKGFMELHGLGRYEVHRLGDDSYVAIPIYAGQIVVDIDVMAERIEKRAAQRRATDL